MTGNGGRLTAVVGFAAVPKLLPYRKLLVEGASWQAALDLAGVAA